MKKIDLISFFIACLVFMPDISSEENLTTNSNQFVYTTSMRIPDNSSTDYYSYGSGVAIGVEVLSYDISFFKLDLVNDILVSENLPKLKDVSYGYSPKIGFSLKNISLFISYAFYNNSYRIGTQKVSYNLISNKIELRYNYFLTKNLNLFPSIELMTAEDRLYYVKGSGQFLGLLDSDKTFLRGYQNVYFNPGVGLEYLFNVTNHTNLVIGSKFNYVTIIYMKDDLGSLFSSNLSNSCIFNIYTRLDLDI